MVSIRDIFEAHWIEISSSEEVLFDRFLQLFREYNAHTNLSAIRDDAGIIEKHFVDSVVLDRYIEIRGSVLDIGSGGGFPGIPLSIRHPDARFVLLDSVGKKTRAIDHFSLGLGLPHVQSIHDRAENALRDTRYRRAFDFVLSRATAYLPQILAWAEPFLSASGCIILYKLPSDKELYDGVCAARTLGLKLSRQERYVLAGQERVLLFFSRWGWE